MNMSSMGGSSGGGDSGLSTYTAILDQLGGLLEGIGSYYEGEHQDEYQSRKDAWQRLVDQIDKENRQRRERVQRRNEVISQMGGGWESRSPKPKEVDRTFPSYTPDATAEYLNKGAGLIGGISELLGGQGAQSWVDEQAAKTDRGATAAAPEQTDVNLSEPDTGIRLSSAAPSSTQGYQYRRRSSYDPYLSGGTGWS